MTPDSSLTPRHTTTFTYDVMGNLTAETATNETTGQQHTLRHTHDVLGNRTRTTLPALPASSSLERTLHYQLIEKHWFGTASYFRPENKVSLGTVEGLNNKIRAIQRTAYGYRDEEYLRLKIIASFLPPLPKNARLHPH